MTGTDLLRKVRERMGLLTPVIFFLEISAWSTPMAVEDKAVANLRDVGMTTTSTFQLVFGVKLKTV